MISDRDLVRGLGPIGRAFLGGFDSLREVQRQTIRPVYAGRNVLVSSATASGKTEAVFAPLVARVHSLEPRTKEDVLVLGIAPTRALVNDLHARLEAPLAEIRWSCGRQTSDHQDKARRPHVLITTPESFDSMLVRDSEWRDGNLHAHLLAHVAAVFIDEAHLFESSPRGAQLLWLLARLRRLREHSHRQGWARSQDVQVCGASATVADAGALAGRLLGAGSVAVCVQGRREIEIFVTRPSDAWIPLENLADIQAINCSLGLSESPDDLTSVVARVWSAIEQGDKSGCRKMLIFVPTRALCDRLSLALADFLRTRRAMFVGAHHGSLERTVREAAENAFSTGRDAVLVATTTLEVGIDIGDVDVVAIVGAPPDTASLLQRIGRSGRRSGRVRVLPIARTAIEGRAFASMLDAACRGRLDLAAETRLWSVFVQQAASYTVQGGKRGRRKADLLALAQIVWPEPNEPVTASRIVDALVEGDVLAQSGDRIFLGAEWSDRFERGGGDFHHNLGAGNGGVPVIDGSTGEIITHVSRLPQGGGGVALAGKRWHVVSSVGEIVVRSAAHAAGDIPFRYAARSAPTGRRYAEHVRRGFGFYAEAAPVLLTPNGAVWFHFGGSAFEAILKTLVSGLRSMRGLTGLALAGDPSEQAIRAVTRDAERLAETLRNCAADLATPMTLGPYHRLLPSDVRTEVCLKILDSEGFVSWLASRDLRRSDRTVEAEGRLRETFGW